MIGRVFAVVGPSGAGKDTLLAGACAREPRLHLVRRVITRPESAGGEGFEGVDEAEFERRRQRGEFVLEWRAHGLGYAVPRAELAVRATGRDVVFNGSRAALAEARARIPDLHVILVTAPVAMLAARLGARGRESAEVIAARLERAALEEGPIGAEAVVVNDSTPEDGIARLLAALQPPSGAR